MQRAGVEASICDRLRRHPCKTFAGEQVWLMRLAGLSLDVFDRNLVRILTEGALWGAVRAQGLMRDTVVVSDDAGQFRVADHALCWVHAERLMQKLMPATARHEKAVKTVRDRVWKLYRALKLWKAQPVPEATGALAACFDKIFTLHTGFQDLDRLLARLHRRKASLLKVLERPEIPLHTNASENDLRACVTKRKISGGTMSAQGRQARDVMLGLMKTCRKLGLSFFAYLGARLSCGDPADPPPPLARLVASGAV
jgi:hypothetical protein